MEKLKVGDIIKPKNLERDYRVEIMEIYETRGLLKGVVVESRIETKPMGFISHSFASNLFTICTDPFQELFTELNKLEKKI